jgi:hypothetical protein
MNHKNLGWRGPIRTQPNIRLPLFVYSERRGPTEPKVDTGDF